MTKAFLAPSLLFALLASACDKPVETPPLAGAALGGAFTLTDETGARSSSSRFDGQYRMVYFGYTFCPDICPVDMQVLMKGFALFEQRDPERAAKVTPIFISVDPARDTPEVIRQWTDAFHPRLIGFTGKAAEIADVAKDYGIYYKAQAANASGAYLVDHARLSTLFDPTGAPIVLLPHDQTAEAVAAELDRWVR